MGRFSKARRISEDSLLVELIKPRNNPLQEGLHRFIFGQIGDEPEMSWFDADSLIVLCFAFVEDLLLVHQLLDGWRRLA